MTEFWYLSCIVFSGWINMCQTHDFMTLLSLAPCCPVLGVSGGCHMCVWSVVCIASPCLCVISCIRKIIKYILVQMCLTVKIWWLLLIQSSNYERKATTHNLHLVRGSRCNKWENLIVHALIDRAVCLLEIDSRVSSKMIWIDLWTSQAQKIIGLV